MIVFLRLFALTATLFGIAACNSDINTTTTTPSTLIGTKAVVSTHGSEMILEVKDVFENIYISEVTDWNDQIVSRRHYYRGLYPVAGIEENSQWEREFDLKKIDAIFPLKVGNKTEFSGIMKENPENETYSFSSHIKVAAAKSYKLSDKLYKVFILKIVTEYTWGNHTKRVLQTVYYAPELSMNLKSIHHKAGSQRFWRVISITLPNEKPTKDPIRPRRRSSGTVMI